MLEKHPNNPLAHYWRAQAKAKLGDMAAARDELAAAKPIDPSLKFAGSREALAKLESRIAESEPVQHAAEAASSAELVASMTAPQGMPSQPVELGPVAEGAGKPGLNDAEVYSALDNAGVYLKWILGIAVVGGVIAAVAFSMSEGRDEKQRLKEARNRWAAKLRDAEADLDDAIKKSDADIDRAPETKLGNYDRCNAARNAIATQLGAIQKVEDFREAQLTVERAHESL